MMCCRTLKGLMNNNKCVCVCVCENTHTHTHADMIGVDIVDVRAIFCFMLIYIVRIIYYIT